MLRFNIVLLNVLPIWAYTPVAKVGFHHHVTNVLVCRQVLPTTLAQYFVDPVQEYLALFVIMTTAPEYVVSCCTRTVAPELVLITKESRRAIENPIVHDETGR